MPVVSRSSCGDQGPGTPHPRRIREWRLGTPWIRRCLGSCQVRKEERDEDMHVGGYANDMTAGGRARKRFTRREREAETEVVVMWLQEMKIFKVRETHLSFSSGWAGET